MHFYKQLIFKKPYLQYQSRVNQCINLEMRTWWPRYWQTVPSSQALKDLIKIEKRDNDHMRISPRKILCICLKWKCIYIHISFIEGHRSEQKLLWRICTQIIFIFDKIFIFGPSRWSFCCVTIGSGFSLLCLETYIHGLSGKMTNFFNMFCQFFIHGD